MCLKNLEIVVSKIMDYAQVITWVQQQLNSMLNMRKVELEFISDVDIYSFFGNSIRVGVSYISIKQSEANNKYLKSYDSKKNLSISYT